MKRTKKTMMLVNLASLGPLLLMAAATVLTSQEVKAQTYEASGACSAAVSISASPMPGCPSVAKGGDVTDRFVGDYCSTHGNYCCTYAVYKSYCPETGAYLATNEILIGTSQNSSCTGSTCIRIYYA